MSDVTVTAKMTQKQAGAMYMKCIRQEKRIKKLEEGLKKILSLAESTENWIVATAAKATLETGDD